MKKWEVGELHPQKSRDRQSGREKQHDESFKHW